MSSEAPKTAGQEDAAQERGVRLAIRILLALGLLSVLAEFVIHRHTEFGFSALPGFYALVGFAAYCAIVLGAKALRPLLKRPEDYYGD